VIDYNSASNSGIPTLSIDTSCSNFKPPNNEGAQLISLTVNKKLII
jgi:hypothetical protein